MPVILSISLGAVLGALLRHFMASGIAKIIESNAGFPWGILCVNLLGCFLLGALVEGAALKFSLSTEARAFLAVGVLGSFTTLSTFALDVVLLLERGQVFQAAGYFAASTFLAVAALYLGISFIKAIF